MRLIEVDPDHPVLFIPSLYLPHSNYTSIIRRKSLVGVVNWLLYYTRRGTVCTTIYVMSDTKKTSDGYETSSSTVQFPKLNSRNITTNRPVVAQRS